MQETFETSDIFRSAYLLCQGCELRDIDITDNGSPPPQGRRAGTAVFRIQGDDVSRLDLDYRNGEALVNPLQMKESLNLLKELMFKKIREYERRGDYVHNHP